VEILTKLANDGPKKFTELVEELKHSKRTISKYLDDCEKQEFVLHKKGNRHTTSPRKEGII
jgi:DeoR/GlpR family transcriptional regulator of sugar metabolism